MSERDRIAKIDLVLDGGTEEDVNEAFWEEREEGDEYS